MLIDENIPFRKLGYQSLIAFLRTVSSIRIIEKGNDCFVEAIPSGESAHISKLIARQKTATRKCNKLVSTLFLYIYIYIYIYLIILCHFIIVHYIILDKYSKTNTISSACNKKEYWQYKKW